jgi:hypothetical protein
LGHDDPEPRCDLCYEPDDSRRTLTHDTLIERKIGDLDDPLRELRADGEIIALRRLAIGSRGTQREHFEAGEPGPRIAEILALFSSDRRDCSQHDRGRNRQLYREGRKAEGPADCSGGAGKPRMEFAPTGEPAIFQAEQSDVERMLERMFRHRCDGGRGGSGQRTLDKPDRLAGECGKAAGEARAFEPAHRSGEGLLIRGGEIHG